MAVSQGAELAGGSNSDGLTILHLELVVNRPGQRGSLNYRLFRLSREVCREWRTTVDGKPFYAASAAFLSHLGNVWLRHFCASESVSRYISMARVIGAGVHPQAENAILAIDQKTRIQQFRSDLRRLSEWLSADHGKALATPASRADPASQEGPPIWDEARRFIERCLAYEAGFKFNDWDVHQAAMLEGAWPEGGPPSSLGEQARSMWEWADIPPSRSALEQGIEQLEVGRVIGTKMHTEEVYCVDTFGGSIVASGSYDGMVKLWDMTTGSPILIDSVQHPDVVYGVSFSPDGTELATACACGLAYVLDGSINVQLRRNIATLSGHGNSVTSVSFDSTGQKLATCSQDKTVKIWRKAANGSWGFLVSIDHSLNGHMGYVYSVAFGAGGIVATGSEDRSVRVWSVNPDGGKLLFLGEGDAGYTVTSVACGAETNLIVSGCSDGTIHMWREGREGMLVLCGWMRHGEEGGGVTVQSVCLSACDMVVASSGSDSLIKVWRVQGKQMLAILQGHGANVTAIRFAAVLDSPDNGQGTVAGGKSRAEEVCVGDVRGKGTWLVSGSCDHSIKVWDVSSILACVASRCQ